jgi:hypothetical protein
MKVRPRCDFGVNSGDANNSKIDQEENTGCPFTVSTGEELDSPFFWFGSEDFISSVGFSNQKPISLASNLIGIYSSFFETTNGLELTSVIKHINPLSTKKFTNLLPHAKPFLLFPGKKPTLLPYH